MSVRPSVEDLERELGKAGPDVSVSPLVKRRMYGQLRMRLTEQFHVLATSARLNGKVGNEEMAQLQEGEARKVLAMIADLDAEASGEPALDDGSTKPVSWFGEGICFALEALSDSSRQRPVGSFDEFSAYPPIADYAFLSDCEVTALVAPGGQAFLALRSPSRPIQR